MTSFWRGIELAERERLGRWTVPLEMFNLRNRLGDAGTMGRRHPPQGDIRIAQALEPLAPALHDVGVRTPVDEFTKRIES